MAMAEPRSLRRGALKTRPIQPRSGRGKHDAIRVQRGMSWAQQTIQSRKRETHTKTILVLVAYLWWCRCETAEISQMASKGLNRRYPTNYEGPSK